MKARNPIILAAALFYMHHRVWNAHRSQDELFSDESADAHHTVPSRSVAHPAIQHDSIAAAIKSSNSSSYHWIGNHWVAPPGVPTFTPAQMRSYFQRRNVLFIGDSTGRRSYATLHGMVNAMNLDDVSVSEIDADHVINRNKGKTTHLCEVPDHTIYPRALIPMAMSHGMSLQLQCHDVVECSMDTSSNGDCTSSNTSSAKKFDYFPAACLCEVIDLFGSEVNATELLEKDPTAQLNRLRHANILDVIKEEYDLVVIMLGVWDVVRAGDCLPSGHPVRERTAADRIAMTLDSLTKHSSSNLQLAFRTTGFDVRYVAKKDVFWEMIQSSLDYFESNVDGSNMTLIDWGSSIAARSYAPNRINGDLASHYGLEARTLFSQQLMHELVKAELSQE